ncbi:ParB/RepB/Spo0J family partition protein [Salidesulfovibrio brasiliensis]|uniref:ParB/RepB/Spo0J family partition protein n=1 Tax=Salidesulfovibrio brasiliensis TaxID=221711 RepID=UPI0006D20990|nr:ParB/RepB/Spo0J family partition protein [Salidesulfovibrio brasiliensis]
MSSMQKGLGRGLDALLGGVREDQQKGVDAASVTSLPVADIVANPNQPRREFSEAALGDLADSIRSQGVLQPVLVRPLGDDRYELVAGERRLRASKLAGLESIPALIKEMTDQESLAVALIENLQREDLNPVEEALGYQQLQQQFGLSQDELSQQVGKSRSAVANALRLLNLPDEIRKDISEGNLSAGHGRALMAVTDPEVQKQLHRRITENGLTVRQAEAQGVFWKQNGRLPGTGEEPRGKAPSQSSGKAELDPVLSELQQSLSSSLNVAVSLSGSTKKGRLSIKFGTEEELRSLVEMLGEAWPEE